MSLKRGSELLGYTEQACHKAMRHFKQKTAHELRLKEKLQLVIGSIRERMPRIGGEKLWVMTQTELAKEGLSIGRDKFVSLYADLGFIVTKRKKRPKTTDSSAWRRQFEDLRKDFVPTKPEELFVADITYIETEQEDAYMPLITDSYSKMIMGYEVATRMRTEECLVALDMAIKNRCYDRLCIHHSDRGSQYLSKAYTTQTQAHNFVNSTTQDGSPYDNPVAERINRIIKEEFGFDGVSKKIKNVEAAKKLLKKAVHMYNNERPHISNHMLTPAQMHKQDTIKIKTWRKNKTPRKD